jgi:hypothetical protein
MCYHLWEWGIAGERCVYIISSLGALSDLSYLGPETRENCSIFGMGSSGMLLSGSSELWRSRQRNIRMPGWISTNVFLVAKFCRVQVLYIGNTEVFAYCIHEWHTSRTSSTSCVLMCTVRSAWHIVTTWWRVTFWGSILLRIRADAHLFIGWGFFWRIA